MQVDVADLSGRTFSIANLQPSDTVSLLCRKVQEAVGKPLLGTTSFSLVVEDSVLTNFDLWKALQCAGVEHGMVLQIVRRSQQDVWENTSNVGDEQQLYPGLLSQTLVRFAALTEKKCLLIRQTSAKRLTGGSVTWDICRGTYTMREGSIAACAWELCYRRSRSGMQTGNSMCLLDSGWVRKHEVPECWNRIKLDAAVWASQQAFLHEGRRILGIKLFGTAEAMELLDMR